MEERKRKRQEGKGSEESGVTTEKVRSFKQNTLLGSRNGEGLGGKVSERVISKLFANRK